MNFPISGSEFKQIWRKSKQDLILTQATALAYTTLLSLVPILAVGFFIFQAFGGFSELQDTLQPLIEQNLAPAFSASISGYLDNFVTNVHAKTIGIFGLIGFIFTSISTLATVEKTFNIIFGTSRQRSWSKRIATYWSLLTIGPLLLGVSIMLSSKALAWLKMDNGFIAKMLVGGFELLPYLASGLLFSALYIFLPNISVDKKEALKAGLVAGVAFELAKIIYALYAVHAIAQNKVYGSLIVIPIFLIWLYVVWLIILFGAELCCFFQFKTMKVPYRFDSEERLDPFIVVDIVDALGKTQNSPRGGLSLSNLVEALKVPMKEVIRHLEFLQKEGWVIAAERNFLTAHKFFLTVPQEKIDPIKIFKQLEEGRYSPRSVRGQEAQGRFNTLWAQWAAENPTSKTKNPV